MADSKHITMTGNRFSVIILSILSMLNLHCYHELPEYGVTTALASLRAGQLRALSYQLNFIIPDEREDSIVGSVCIRGIKNDAGALILDFKADSKQIIAVKHKSEPVKYTFSQGHLIVAGFPADSFQLNIDFIAGNGSLNRSAEYLYTLLVPDRASTVFPCFDQPDLKARFQLILNVPNEWKAIGNGAILNIDTVATRKVYHFAETLPISTYLFAFAAGKFSEIVETGSSMPVRLYHRETDTAKVQRNVDKIFSLHRQSVRWMEDYTGIPYPFGKLDVVLLPAFQYGGMEHIGAIFYKASSLFLDENATESQWLGQASLIAHETAHMWFGDLVTMKWFNDVWLKEVFANFFAAKIVNPSFPEVNHELRFLLAHHPAAYAEDRTEGSHPIQQTLENLLEAGSLYGNIIYTKAPVVMRQLEEHMGIELFRQGLQKYLQKYSFANATWDDLIQILDDQTPQDLVDWSAPWIKQPHMPVLSISRLADQRLMQLNLENTPPQGKPWMQPLNLVWWIDSARTIKQSQLWIDTSQNITWPADHFPAAMLPNGTPSNYGYFKLDETSLAWFANHAHVISDELLRGIVYLNLFEEFLHQRISISVYWPLLVRGLEHENNIQIASQLINHLQEVFWHYLPLKEQLQQAAIIERILQVKLNKEVFARNKMIYFRAWSQMAITPEGVNALFEVWDNSSSIPGITLSVQEQANLAVEIILRNHPMAEKIIQLQLDRFSNADDRERWIFLTPALSMESNLRDQFFDGLSKEQNRHYEPWVQDGLAYINHPLRSELAIKYITPALELMQDIQDTGDIFFPKRWISAVLHGHNSPKAAHEVHSFFQKNPNYPFRLKNKILQAADPLFRRANNKQKVNGHKN